MGRILIILGVVMVLVGILASTKNGLSWIGKLPGDFSTKIGSVKFYFPLTTSILLSILLTVISLIFAFFKTK